MKGYVWILAVTFEYYNFIKSGISIKEKEQQTLLLYVSYFFNYS